MLSFSFHRPATPPPPTPHQLSQSRAPLESSNSNYFRRAKDHLQSSDSLHKAGAAGGPGGQQQARSAHDLMYGSKLSTRVQDTARSAWKKSRKFASSVVTGGLMGGGLSACRRNTKQRASCCSSSNTVRPAQYSQTGEQQCTSVIEVGPTVGDFASVSLAANGHSATQHNNFSEQQQQQQATAPMNDSEAVVKVDQNNKLTIVTKFNGRCQSASLSGRETNASDSGADSAGSQSGDLCERDQGPGAAASEPIETSSAAAAAAECKLNAMDEDEEQQAAVSPAISTNSSSGCASSAASNSSQEYNRRHKRRSSSSMFSKPAKVFSGSQASLNKLRSFFALASSAASTTNGDNKEQAATKESPAAPEQLRIETLSATGPKLALSGQPLEELLRHSSAGQGEPQQVGESPAASFQQQRQVAPLGSA